MWRRETDGVREREGREERRMLAIPKSEEEEEEEEEEQEEEEGRKLYIACDLM